MYRNTYLELYKSNANQQPSLTKLMTHFTQIYHTLGCVLQDLEYQIGQISTEKTTEKAQEIYSNFSKKSNNKHKDKEIIKIENTISQNVDRNVPQLKEKPPKVSSIKNPNNEDRAKEEEYSSQSQECDWLLNRFGGGFPKNKEAPSEKKDNKEGLPPIVERPRHVIASGNDSFDSLFENKGPVRMDIESHRKGPMPVIPQVPESQSEPQIDNSYEDFLQRIFKQGESRKSR